MCDRSSAGDLPHTRLPPADPYPCRKEEKQMNKLTQALMEELTVEYVKVGSLQIPESVVISWVIMLLLVVGSILLTRNLKVDHISKRQAALEALYSLGKNFFEGLLGSDAEQVVILVLASHGLLDTLPTAEQREKTAAFVRQFRADVSGTMQKIDADGKLEPDRVDAILNAWKAYAGGNDHVVQ